MIKLILPILLLLPATTLAHATPTQAESLCEEVNAVLQEFVGVGSNPLSQQDVDRITDRCYANYAS